MYSAKLQPLENQTDLFKVQLPVQTTNSAIDRHFLQLKRRVQRRLESPKSLDWLLEFENSPFYQPDYLTMTTAGRNRLEQTLNRLFSRLSPKLWYKLFWPKITGKILTYAEDQYLNKIFRSVEDGESIPEAKRYIAAALREILSRKWQNLPHCTFMEIGNSLLDVIHEPLQQLKLDQDFFRQEKQTQNKVCLDLYRQIHLTLNHSPKRLNMLIYMVCRANWIDSLENDVKGMLNDFVEDVRSNLTDGGLIKNIPIDSNFFQLEKVRETLQSTSGPILYETDNCGEIVFDLALIEELIAQGRKVYLCVKERPLVNDATEKDVREVLDSGLFSKLKEAERKGDLRFVTAGVFRGGGKLAHEINESYKKAYSASELVIIKGQGNFQSMPMALPTSGNPRKYRYKKPIIFMTGVRAEMIRMSLVALFPAKKRPPINSILLQVFSSEN